MSIQLPALPAPNDANPFYVDKGGILRPIGNGDDQKLNRLGDRFGIEVTYPPLPAGDAGRIWIAKLVQAQREGVLLSWPQLDLIIGAPGAAVVDGANQAGSTLAMRELTPSYAIRYGQFFSIIHGGRRYLQMATAQTIVGADGKATVPISPMMRARPSDGDVCDFADPMVEGFIEGNERGWNLNLARTVGISFRVVEAQ